MSTSTIFSIPFKFSTLNTFSKPLKLSSSFITKSSPLSSLSLSSSNNISSFSCIELHTKCSFLHHHINHHSSTIVAAKGYKMKTHKASAKRFRVTGSGKIVRRRAGKQHLLGKKNTKRKLRLSKMVQVDRSDYNNVIGALPYLKVNRQN
ncbi:hypothetical protein Leryth_015405 [Lithospermum erythrorhizon]|nr:hypothetical protein Leryth_015405 [Lithospermum erythrorhizon]